MWSGSDVTSISEAKTVKIFKSLALKKEFFTSIDYKTSVKLFFGF